MRMSRLLVRTLREAPADAEVAGHQLLVRAGYIRRLASGVYTFLPLGVRVLHNIERVIRQELDAAGCQELLLPALHPIELWEQSGRADLFGTEAMPAMVVHGRGGDFVLGPTHEEVATVTVGAEIESYRQLPVTVYQVQVKFRDEARPRFGLLRTRELVMADAYSFDVDKEAMQQSYGSVFDAYLRIFGRLGLDVFPVEAQSGAIGGDVNHEFMVPSVVGEDHFVQCASCGYAANVEAAERRMEPDLPSGGGAAATDAAPALVDHHTRDRPGIAQVVAYFADQGDQGDQGDQEATGDRPLPTPLMVARHLASRDVAAHPEHAVLWASARWITTSGSDATALGEQLRGEGTRICLILVADGAACHGPKAPRAEDSRAPAYEDAVCAALASGQGAHLAQIDADLGRELGATLPQVWPVLLAAADGEWIGELAWRGAPYGVGWAVAAWRRNPTPAASWA